MVVGKSFKSGRSLLLADNRRYVVGLFDPLSEGCILCIMIVEP